MMQEQPTSYFSVSEPTIERTRAALTMAIGHVEETLQRHDTELGRTTRKNEYWAQVMEADIREMKELLVLLPVGLKYAGQKSD